MRTSRFRVSFLTRGLLWILPLLAAPMARAQSAHAETGNPWLQAANAREFNQSLEQSHNTPQGTSSAPVDESRIGPDDLLDITVFEAPEMNRTLRVAANGEISLQLLGLVKASGLTPQELEIVLQEMLRKTYMRDPHVGVFVRELQSHAVSVVGAVKMPGVYQIRGTRTVIELISMAQGLSDDAGDTVLVMRGAGLTAPGDLDTQIPAQQQTGTVSPAVDNEITTINLKSLLESTNPALNVSVHSGDIVKVTRAGIVYVVGEVGKPGGFVLKSNENISVLQAIALAEGLTRTSAKSQARIIRTEQTTDKRIEIPLDLGKILASKAPDLMLQPKDVVFVPNSAGKTALYRSAQAALTTASGVAIYGRW
jgi:polysaccharide biosynthesis/export protein